MWLQGGLHGWAADGLQSALVSAEHQRHIQISHYSLIKGVSDEHVIDELSGESRRLERLILFLIKHSGSTAPLLHAHINNALTERDPNLARAVSRLCAVVREDEPFKRRRLQMADCCTKIWGCASPLPL